MDGTAFRPYRRDPFFLAYLHLLETERREIGPDEANRDLLVRTVEELWNLADTDQVLDTDTRLSVLLKVYVPMSKISKKLPAVLYKEACADQKIIQKEMDNIARARRATFHPVDKPQ